MITNKSGILLTSGDDWFVVVDSFLKYLDSLFDSQDKEKGGKL